MPFTTKGLTPSGQEWQDCLTFFLLTSILKIDAGEKDELQKEAEEMNELGIRKLPKDDDGPDPEKVPTYLTNCYPLDNLHQSPFLHTKPL